MSAELRDLEEQIAEIEEVIAAIRAKLEKARAEVHLSGEYADPDWYRRAKAALRFKGIEHQRLLREAAALRRQEKRHRAKEFGEAFIDAARRRLDPEVFSDLLDEAREVSE